MSSALHIHASFVNTVTLRLKDQPSSIWADARDAGREVLERFFRSDGRDVLESMLGLSVVITEERKRKQRARRAKAKGQAIPQPTPVAKLHHSTVNKQLWSTAYNLLSPTDVSGVAMMMRSVAPFAHVEKLNRDETWSWKELGLQEVIKEDVFVSGVRAINNCIAIARDSFSQAIESLAVQPDTSLPRSLWDEPGAAKAGIILLLSPADDVHEPIISLIQQSFDDVDDRGDCFRVLLDRYPTAAMDGLCQFLSDFIDTANLTPESCSLAKWLVRCFTDVLEALCQASNAGEPLLQSPRFLSTFVDDLSMSRRVYNLWHLMTTSLAVIFKRTQDWAPLYDNETMVDWMRDALIFGRNLTEHIRAFEAAALGVSSGSSRFVDNGESPAKPTKTGTKLVQKLENVLRDLVSWMRLTESVTLSILLAEYFADLVPQC
jgi:senataxin